MTPVKLYPPKPEKVYFFGTCLIDLFYPEAGMDGIRLLEREGIEVLYPQAQTCCGQPAYTSGYQEEARRWRRHSSTCSPSPGRSSYLPAPVAV
jgi:L-lactate dehydrogenase complex protein LldE